MIPCLFKSLFGIECLGCGFQRAVVLLFKGDFIEAFYQYPGIYLVFLFVGLLIFYKVFQNKNGTKPMSVVGFFAVSFIIAGYIYKNI